MINLKEVNETIERLKREGMTIQAAERLAMLYMLRDHLIKEGQEPEQTTQGYSRAAAPTTEMPIRPRTRRRSEFIDACEGVMIDDLLDVLDEHMEAIYVLYPKEYEKILRELDEVRI